jgi:hypothetical protein
MGLFIVCKLHANHTHTIVSTITVVRQAAPAQYRQQLVVVLL